MVGRNTTDELWNINHKRMQRFVDKILPFIEVHKGIYVDVGERNPKMEYVKSKLGIHVNQLDGNDFNFDTFKGLYGKADTVFIFEVLEHLQNPLFFMNEVKKCLEDGTIYVTMPCNPRWLWVDGHYFEIPPKHFNRWIIEPLGLKIIKHKRIWFFHDWKGIFIGVRPLLRVLSGQQDWKSLLRTFLYFKYDFYEIKKDNI